MPSVQMNRYIKQRENEAYQRGRKDMKRELKEAGLKFVEARRELKYSGFEWHTDIREIELEE